MMAGEPGPAFGLCCGIRREGQTVVGAPVRIPVLCRCGDIPQVDGVNRMVVGVYIVQNRAVFRSGIPRDVTVQSLILRVGVHVKDHSSVILVVYPGTPVILVEPRIGPHQGMPRRNLRVLIQAEENLHLPVSLMISTGKLLIINDKVVACGTDRALKLFRCRCVNEGRVNGHRVSPVLRLHPILVCRHGEHPATVLRLGQAICHRLGADILGVCHVGGGNPVHRLS